MERNARSRTAQRLHDRAKDNEELSQLSMTVIQRYDNAKVARTHFLTAM